MNNQIPKEIRRWESRRKLGKGKFVFLFGILIWGGTVGVITQLFDGWRRGFSVSNLIIGMTVCLVGGWIVGHIFWTKSEEKYRRFEAENTNNA